MATKNKKTLAAGLIGAALAGLIAGSAYAEEHGAAAGGHEEGSKMSAGAAAHADGAHDAGKHECKGKNSCKGNGGCKAGDHGCKGKNSCKGKGGCATNKETH